MKRGLVLLSVVASAVLANDVIETPTINIEEKVNIKVVKDVSSDEIKSADLAEALMKNVPSVSMVRRSGIANDIIVRGAKKDNINVILDDAKIYGACPNRMDPATSHVLTNNIESVEVIEGPYDVENFGTLSGLVKVNLKEPSKEFSGDVNLNFGSFSYKKQSATVQGGNDYVRVLVSASNEESKPYEDGNGRNFLEQQQANGTPFPHQYSAAAKDAYEKQTLLTKLAFDISDNSELKLSYTANRSDEVLYPNTPMDANFDDSDIYTVGYTYKNLGDFSKELDLEYYYSRVDHPMSTRLRNRAGATNNVTNNMKSSIWGAKIKNGFELAQGYAKVGLDTSTRNWKGHMSNDINPLLSVSLPSTDTENRALFATYERSFGDLNIEVGARFDDTAIDTIGAGLRDRDYENFNANIFSSYKVGESSRVFAGVGTSSRVPDARELYYAGSGNDDLKETQNREIDLGFETMIADVNIKTKVFYSDLKDYIYNQQGVGFVNTDASIYGLDISGTAMLTDSFFIDYGVAYQRGEKDEALAGQTDKDLAEIPPLKGQIGFNYETDRSLINATVIAAKSWSNFDADNDEQELDGYAVLNLKYDYEINQNFDFTLGVDNVFDKAYATTNTYNDITYIGAGPTQLINEPGRYFYVNLRYSF